MPSKRAGVSKNVKPAISDIAVFGDLDLSNNYPPGTYFHMPDGAEVDVNALPDFIGDASGAPKTEDKAPPPK